MSALFGAGEKEKVGNYHPGYNIFKAPSDQAGFSMSVVIIIETKK